MKNLKYIFILITLFMSVISFSQSTTQSYTSTLPFGNLDNLQIYNAVRLSGGGGGGGSSSVTVTSGTVTTLLPSATVVFSSSSNTVVGSATVTSGAYSVNFLTSSDFTGTINGVSRLGGTSVSVAAPLNNSLPAIPYSITTGTLYIDTTKP